MAKRIAILGIIVTFAWIGIILAMPPPETTTSGQGGMLTTRVLSESTGQSTHVTLTKEKTLTMGMIKDLQYIRILTSTYSDDADPEPEGVSIDIMYYDSKSESINFRNTPVFVHIELYGYRERPPFEFDHNKMERVYGASIIMDHSMTMSEMFGKYIRIPFEDISIDQTKYDRYGTVKVTVETAQGTFSTMEDIVMLYPKP